MSGRVVLVTGSTSGIGRATAERFAARGDVVVFNSSRSAAEGARLAAATPGAHYIQGSVGAEGGAETLIAEVLERCGRLDVLVNNAATTREIPHRDLAAASREVWREIFEVNVFGTWSMCVAAMEALAASHGCIVNVGSLAGVRPTGSSIPYAASKAAIHHLTVLLAKTVGPAVRVNAVAPGLVDTPWTASWARARERVEANAPLHRSGKPEDIAEVIVDVAAHAYLTGQVIVVDGGLGLVS